MSVLLGEDRTSHVRPLVEITRQDFIDVAQPPEVLSTRGKGDCCERRGKSSRSPYAPPPAIKWASVGDCPLRQQANLYHHIFKKGKKSTAFFKVVLHQFGSLKTTILIRFPWKRAYFPLPPKSVKVSLALHSLREPCPRVTAGLVRLILRIMQKR